MIGAVRTPAQQVVTVFGGTGFLGRQVVSALAHRGYRVLVPTRQLNLAAFLPLGRVGQICPIHTNLRHPESVAHAVAKADHVINLVGILQERGRQTFDAVHVQGARLIAEAAAARNASLVHVSALGVDPQSESAYARSKAEGEAAVFGAKPDAVVIRPSILFGPGDSFFTRFASLARTLPVLPLAGAETRFQPVYAGDVAAAILKAVDGGVLGGQVYEFGGPQILTLRALVEYVLTVTGRKRLIVPVPKGLARAQGTVLGLLDKLTLGLIPNEMIMTHDQAILLERDNVVSESAIRDARTLEGLGIMPTAFEAIVESYLIRFRKTGQFDLQRNTTETMPDLLAPKSGGPASGHHPERASGSAATHRPTRR